MFDLGHQLHRVICGGGEFAECRDVRGSRTKLWATKSTPNSNPSATSSRSFGVSAGKDSPDSRRLMCRRLLSIPRSGLRTRRAFRSWTGCAWRCPVVHEQGPADFDVPGKIRVTDRGSFDARRGFARGGERERCRRQRAEWRATSPVRIEALGVDGTRNPNGGRWRGLRAPSFGSSPDGHGNN